MDEPNCKGQRGDLLISPKRVLEALDKERDVGYIKTAERDERKHKDRSFSRQKDLNN
jgi:hypothetical protein